MSVGQQLHELIRSMTPSEKGYFKKYTSKHIIGDSNDYMILFETLDGMGVYDDEVLNRKQAVKSFTKHLPGVKNYLYNQILESLRSYHSGKNLSQKIQERLFEVRLLSERGLYEQAEKICKKAVEQAREIENNGLYLDSLALYMLVISHLGHIKHFREESFIITDELEKASEKVYNEYLYWIFNLRLEDKVVITGETGDSVNEMMEDLIADKLMNSTIKPESFRAWLSYSFSLSVYYNATDESHKKSLELTEQVVNEFEAKPERKKNFFGLYVGALNSLLANYCLCGCYDKYEENIHRLRDASALRGLTDYQVARSIMLYILSETTFDSTTMNKERFIENVESYTLQFLKYQRYFPVIYLKLFSVQCGSMALLCGMPKIALQWFNRALETDIHVRVDAHRSAEILSLCAHLDSGNESYIEYGIRSMIRTKSKYLPITTFHKQCLQIIKKLTESRRKDQRGKIVQEFVQKHTNNTDAERSLLRFFSLWNPIVQQKLHSKKRY